MVNVTTSDILTEERVRRVVEEEQEEVLLFDEVYNVINMPDDHPDTMQIPEDDAIMGEPSRVHEASEFPREEENHSKTPITVKKYGFEIAISMESQMYSIFDVVARQVEKASRKMAELINRKAYNELDGNTHANTSTYTGLNNFNYGNVVDARKELLDDLYTPQMLIVNTTAEADLLKSDEFTRASDLGDDTIQDGVIGRIAGLDVMVDNSGLIDTAESTGYIVDPNEYGYEVIREDVATEEYESPERQADIFQLYTFREWKAINSNAAIKVSTGS